MTLAQFLINKQRPSLLFFPIATPNEDAIVVCLGDPVLKLGALLMLCYYVFQSTATICGSAEANVSGKHNVVQA